jgi:anti-sigma B factor antagonist
MRLPIESFSIGPESQPRWHSSSTRQRGACCRVTRAGDCNGLIETDQCCRCGLQAARRQRSGSGCAVIPALPRQAIAKQRSKRGCRVGSQPLGPGPRRADYAHHRQGGTESKPAAAFWIRESQTGHGRRLSLTGELDLVTTPILEDRLTRPRANRAPVVLDLSELEFIDSTGIRLLVRMVGDARIKRWQLQIEPDVRPRVMQVLKLMHLERIRAGGDSTADCRGVLHGP